MNIFKKLFTHGRMNDDIIEEYYVDRTLVYNAYESLVKAIANKKITKAEMLDAMETAVGYLGEVLD